MSFPNQFFPYQAQFGQNYQSYQGFPNGHPNHFHFHNSEMPNDFDQFSNQVNSSNHCDFSNQSGSNFDYSNSNHSNLNHKWTQNFHDSYSQAYFNDHIELKIREMQKETKKLLVNSVCKSSNNDSYIATSNNSYDESPIEPVNHDFTPNSHCSWDPNLFNSSPYTSQDQWVPTHNLKSHPSEPNLCDEWIQQPYEHLTLESFNDPNAPNPPTTDNERISRMERMIKMMEKIMEGMNMGNTTQIEAMNEQLEIDPYLLNSSNQIHSSDAILESPFSTPNESPFDLTISLESPSYDKNDDEYHSDSPHRYFNSKNEEMLSFGSIHYDEEENKGDSTMPDHVNFDV